MRYNSDKWIKRGSESHPGGRRNCTDIISALQSHFQDLWVVNVLARLLLVLARARLHVTAGIPVTPKEHVVRKREHPGVAGHMRCVFMEGLLNDRVKGKPCHLAMVITPQPRSRSAFLIRLPCPRGVAGNTRMFGGSSGQISGLTGQL